MVTGDVFLGRAKIVAMSFSKHFTPRIDAKKRGVMVAALLFLSRGQTETYMYMYVLKYATS